MGSFEEWSKTFSFVMPDKDAPTLTMVIASDIDTTVRTALKDRRTLWLHRLPHLYICPATSPLGGLCVFHRTGIHSGTAQDRAKEFWSMMEDEVADTVRQPRRPRPAPAAHARG